MKISDMITQLQAIQEEHGDLQVCCWPYDGQGRTYEPELKLLHSTGKDVVVEIDGG